MMDQVIGEVKQTQVRYIIWSNRKFYEYGVPEFGVDFDVPSENTFGATTDRSENSVPQIYRTAGMQLCGSENESTRLMCCVMHLILHGSFPAADLSAGPTGLCPGSFL